MNVVALILLAGGVILLAYLRRRNAKAKSERRIATISATTPAENAKPPQPENRISQARRRQFLPVIHERRSGLPRRRRDHPQGGMGRIVTEELDSLGEAEAYLANGRDRDAEYILKDAIAKHPARHELKIKLLDLYRQRQDQVAFYVLAEELYAALGGGGGELWDQVEVMARRLNPDNLMSPVDLLKEVLARRTRR